ncbi:glycoside hydrolase family 79 protein [Amanita thiersii Skay4041]|uniref:Glycoside hydrolase family 79 protein n=1 Tax=Amanita thiersii Skay4041 TaxID=703135 RepID=A0A2A9NR06_9AGAR|nr:glycoside hydrolase family 79 protein [Amanita thiersii Skay4041]
MVLKFALGVLIVICHVASLYVDAVTVYYQQGQSPFATTSANAANYTGAAAYNPTVLQPPPVPPGLPTQYAIQLQNGGAPAGVSIPQLGSFVGFSIEMSVVNQVLGKNASLIQVPFLNLMANLQRRSGRINIRVGGNTQETAVLVNQTKSGRMLEKDLDGVTNPTQTPPLDYTAELFYLMRNISNFVNARWFLGIPFNDSSNFRLGVADVGQRILGDYLIGLQAGNEPDLYARHMKRPPEYSPQSYSDEFGQLINAMSGDEHATNRNLLIGPSLATGDWFPEMVWNTGFVDTYSQNLAFLAMEHYPTDNCFAQFNVGTPRNAQDIFPSFLNHTAGISLISIYLNSTAYAQSKGKKMLMFETNTASCGGFAGLSDSFGAALWGLDYALQMAYSNFSMGLFHIGGQNVFYNPFTPPPTNQSTFHQWTIGPIYYTSLIAAEVLGSTDKAQVLDMNLYDQSISIFTPAYVIYEDGNPIRVALFNYVTDPSGASDVTVNIAIGGGATGQPNGTPAQVKVKYFRASSVSQKGNFTWAGQTFGGNFNSDGRFMGNEDIQTVNCDQGANTCAIKVPAPSFALVFLTDNALVESGDNGKTTLTFSTTALTKTVNTATVDPSVLATSNGHGGPGSVRKLGSTSKGSISGARGEMMEKNMLSCKVMEGVLVSIAVGLSLVVHGWWL